MNQTKLGSTNLHTQRWINLLMTLVLCLLLIMEAPTQETMMAIEFDGSSNELDFGVLAQLNGLSARSICLRVYLDTLDSGGTDFWIGRAGFTGDAFTSGWFLDEIDGRIRLYQTTTGNYGVWRTAAILSVSTWYQICITHDLSSTSNDPIMYLNGSSQSITDLYGTSGTFISDATRSLHVGGILTGHADGPSSSHVLDGKINDVRMYNRILTPAEIVELYAGGTIENGLIFHAPLLGAAGGADDGDALGATAYVYDRISGAVGTPSGNPIFRADTQLIP